MHLKTKESSIPDPGTLTCVRSTLPRRTIRKTGGYFKHLPENTRDTLMQQGLELRFQT
jgi:hypothetical protein